MTHLPPVAGPHLVYSSDGELVALVFLGPFQFLHNDALTNGDILLPL